MNAEVECLKSQSKSVRLINCHTFNYGKVSTTTLYLRTANYQLQILSFGKLSTNDLRLNVENQNYLRHFTK